MCAPLITCFQRTRFTYMHKDCIGKKTGLLWIANHFLGFFAESFEKMWKKKLWLSTLPLKSNQRKEKHHWRSLKRYFLTFPACFSIPIIFSNFDFNCSNLSSPRNLQKQVKKAFCYQELFLPFTVWINCSSDLKKFANSPPLAWNQKVFLNH